MTIEIRYYNKEDAKDHCEAVKASLNALKTWFTWAKPDYCLCDSIKFIEEQFCLPNVDKYEFAIIDEEDGQFMGSCSLTRVKTYNGQRIASMSYWRRQDSAKKHVASCAANKLKNKAFHDYGIERIEIDIADCNEYSRKVAYMIGAHPERNIQICGGDGKRHCGKRYVIWNETTNAKQA